MDFGVLVGESPSSSEDHLAEMRLGDEVTVVAYDLPAIFTNQICVCCSGAHHQT